MNRIRSFFSNKTAKTIKSIPYIHTHSIESKRQINIKQIQYACDCDTHEIFYKMHIPTNFTFKRVRVMQTSIDNQLNQNKKQKKLTKQTKRLDFKIDI